ncbi:putative F-box/kelch-repeat protein [Arabidopsis thaliana]|uniref:F-box domain-containing protein n=2 Tax=Arabidopsis TaxID=3701 RepID=A0A178VWF1_ARATH|nr:Kelch repeat type 1 [Arabidopsis thaliana x Arabidopsis arenosa]OAP10198.1 hypothetical protein AXX17_AT2G25710 [Arabidopsis thaliana]
MVVLHEIPDGPNGDDPNNNPQEGEDNQNENPQEEVKNLRNLLELPEELIERLIAHIPRCDYPYISLVSRDFRQVITSDKLFRTRSLLGFNEPVLYALIGSTQTPLSWFFLRWSNFPLELHRIRSLPTVLLGAAVVTIGYKMYVMGGTIGLNHPVSTVIVIDCRNHTWNYLPDMKRARYRAAAGEIGGRIYVIGGRKKQDADWVEVFNATTESWETVSSVCPNDASANGVFSTYVVMQGRIFALDRWGCFAYKPVQGLWQSWGVASELTRFWHPLSSFTVIGELLYTVDLTCSLGHPIVVYYPNESVWRPVMGFHLPIVSQCWSKIANFGGKLVIFCTCLGTFKHILCIVIALEARQGGHIWGVVESNSRVFRDDMMLPYIRLCQTVTF